MSHDQLPTNTSHEHEASAESAMDVIQERFWDPMTEMLERREQHEAYGLDVTSLNQQIQELSDLYYDLGGAELNASSNALANATDNNRDKLNARNEKVADAFHRNLMKHDGVEPEPTPESAPADLPEAPQINSPVETSSKGPKFKVGDLVWYKPVAVDGVSQPTSDWKVTSILPIDEQHPREAVTVELNGKTEVVSVSFLNRMQRILARESTPTPPAPTKTPETPQTTTSEKPTGYPDTREKTNEGSIKVGDDVWFKPRQDKVGDDGKKVVGSFGWKVTRILPPNEKNPNDVAVIERDGQAAYVSVTTLEGIQRRRGVKPPKTEESTVKPARTNEKPTEKSAKKPSAEKPATKSTDKLEDILDINEVDTYPLREKLHKDWFNEIANDTTISTAVKEHRYKLGPEDYVFIKLAEEKLHKFKDVTDPETFKWMSDVLNDTSTSPSMKKFALRNGPNGPKRDSLDTNEIKRRLAAEGVDISGITGEKPATTLNPDMLAELESASQVLGVEGLSTEQAAALADAGDILGVQNNANSRAKLNLGRSVLNSAGNVSRKSYDRARDIAWKSTSWINSSSERDDAPEKTDKEEQREEKAKKIGRWSLFSIQRDEKPKSKAKVQKKGKKVTKKLGKIRDRDVRKRGWL